MPVAQFAIGRIPRVERGPGALARAPQILSRFGKRLLLVTGARSFRSSEAFGRLASSFRRDGFTWEEIAVDGEPSPQFVDNAVRDFGGAGIEVVLGVGGGSALDTAKAVAALLKPGNSVVDHLEGIGPETPYRGPAVPFVAVPTTAGTGSEATKNAVLSVRGKDGFKRSFRDDRLVARWAILDPDLLGGCPRDLIAADGMDALTQLLESYVSSRANPFTDALARGGLALVRDGLAEWHRKGAEAAEPRAAMSLAAFFSGVTLAHAGLGAVHGLASPIGALFPAPHGAVCGTLLAAATGVNIDAMLSHDAANPALAKYADAGRVLCGRADLDDAGARLALVDALYGLTDRLGLLRLGNFGVTKNDMAEIVSGCRGGGMKTNPVILTDTELIALLAERL